MDAAFLAMFGWWKQRRRKRVGQRPFPSSWVEHLEANVAQYAWLTAGDRARLHAATQVLIREKYWEGCNGLEMTDEVRVTIAGQASLMLLGLEDYYFDRLVTVLVYPGQYLAPEKKRSAWGMEEEGWSARLGEAWHSGVVVLSWPDVLEGGRIPTDGRNVVIHEFAHVLDAADLSFDGTPDLLADDQYDTWREVVSAEHAQLVRAAANGRWTLLDRYGAESEAEFFAVATECFFEKPRAMKQRHSRLYRLMQDLFHQDPSERVPT